MTLSEIHGRLSNTIVLFIIAMALWGLWRFWRRQGVDSSYWGALIIGEALFLLQAALGAYIWISGRGVPGSGGIHVLYGLISILAVPGVFLYTRGDDERRAVLIYSVVFLFMIGIAWRAMATGV